MNFYILGLVYLIGFTFTMWFISRYIDKDSSYFYDYCWGYSSIWFLTLPFGFIIFIITLINFSMRNRRLPSLKELEGIFR